MGLDPHAWFGNVELVAAKHIGQETVTYVANMPVAVSKAKRAQSLAPFLLTNR